MDAPPEELFTGLHPVAEQWVDTVVPRDVELLTDHRYSPRYAWMYAYEKRLKRRIEQALGCPLGPRERGLFGPDGVVSEGLSNAFVHGHRRDGRLPIEVGCAVSPGGIGLTIRDRGAGFDVAATVAKAQSAGAYYHMAGNGLRVFLERDDVLAAFSLGGAQLNLLVTWEET